MAGSSSNDASDASNSRRSRLERRRTCDRVTVRTTDEQLAALESLVEAGVYPNRSEAVRAGIEAVIEAHPRDDVDCETD
ncbi:ribbon-helix-helix domain-containing protein [Halovivax sp.]|uniref:ribbon-helix-helix domain-containing protein n=1 Tax=Halovivax sp. TaxID=1935978 RepID=UPI0025BC5A39|nr:ribbon-helix-helix domain-containing protein [Halovivax sp.]